jgi:VCBS repeat-containing protein
MNKAEVRPEIANTGPLNSAVQDIPVAPKPVRLAALKRPGDEEEEKLTDSPQPEAGFQDVIVQDEGAALEAIAPAAPAPEGGFMETLLAQAGTGTGTGAAATGLSAGTAGAIAGGLLLLGAAAGGGGDGGGSGGAGPTAPAPPPPENKPASINASAPQRTGEVYADGGMARRDDDDENPYVTSGRTPLVIQDADGGNDLSFREPTAGQLQGKYGTFTFDTGTGEWTYTLNPGDADLATLDGRGMEYLEVTSMDGTASTVIEVTVYGGGSPVMGAERTVDMQAGGFAVVDISAIGAPDDILTYEYDGSEFYGEYTVFETGGFAFLWADPESEGEYWAYYQATAYYPDYYDDFGQPVYDFDDYYEYEYADITINVSGTAASSELDYAYLNVMGNEGSEGDGFYIAGEEDVPIVLDNEFISLTAQTGNGGEIYTLVIDATDSSCDGPADSLGTFTLFTGDAGVQVFGNGTGQVAIRGTLEDLNEYIVGGGLTFVAEHEVGDGGLSFNLYDSTGYNEAGGSMGLYIEDTNDAPTVQVQISEGPSGEPIVLADPTLYVPEGPDGAYLLNTSFIRVQLFDEEAYEDSDGEVTLRLSVDNGSLYLGDGDYEIVEAGESFVEIRGSLYSVQNALGSAFYTGTGVAGSTATLTVALTDDDEQTATKTIRIQTAGENQAPVITVDATSGFSNFTVTGTGEEGSGIFFPVGETTIATATIQEDQHLSLAGVHITDDSLPGDLMVVTFYSYNYYYDEEGDKSLNGTVGNFYIEPGYTGLTAVEQDQGVMFLLGTLADINAALDAGAIRYATPPDWEGGDLSLDIAVLDSQGFNFMEPSAAQLQIELNVVGVDDIPVVLKEGWGSVYVEDIRYISTWDLVGDGNVVYDAEYHAWHGSGTNDELDIDDFLTVTDVTVASGGGTLARDLEDGGWIYTPAADAENGTMVELSYTFTDGAHTFQNIFNIEVYNNIG